MRAKQVLRDEGRLVAFQWWLPLLTELRTLATILRERWLFASLLLSLLFCSLAYQFPFATTIHIGGDSLSHRHQKGAYPKDHTQIHRIYSGASSAQPNTVAPRATDSSAERKETRSAAAPHIIRKRPAIKPHK